MTAPDAASTMVCSRLGVWSARVPVVSTSYARRGVPVAAQTTSSPRLVSRDAFERCWPVDSAVVRATAGVVVVAATLLPLLNCTSSMRPPLAFSTTRSPPTTRSPFQVRS